MRFHFLAFRGVKGHSGVKEESNATQSTEVRFSSFFSVGFITAIVVNPSERELEKRTSVQSLKGRH